MFNKLVHLVADTAAAPRHYFVRYQISEGGSFISAVVGWTEIDRVSGEVVRSELSSSFSSLREAVNFAGSHARKNARFQEMFRRNIDPSEFTIFDREDVGEVVHLMVQKLGKAA